MLSWNVNGIRAALRKGFMEWFDGADADLLCIQETKAKVNQIPDEIKEKEGYHTFWDDHKEKKGYSGVGMLTKIKPLNVTSSIGNERFDTEGRILCAEFDEFFLYGIYFPNGQSGDERLQYKLDFYEQFLKDAEQKRKSGKGVIICGDVNTAHKPIDLARPKPNETNSGFLPIEREWIDKLVAQGYHDTLRMFTEEGEIYSYWDQRFRARDRNVGWRIDYFFVSEELKDKVKDAFVLMDVIGSDHCPVGIELDL